jgi:hypothetical protein
MVPGSAGLIQSSKCLMDQQDVHALILPQLCGSVFSSNRKYTAKYPPAESYEKYLANGLPPLIFQEPITGDGKGIAVKERKRGQLLTIAWALPAKHGRQASFRTSTCPARRQGCQAVPMSVRILVSTAGVRLNVTRPPPGRNRMSVLPSISQGQSGSSQCRRNGSVCCARFFWRFFTPSPAADNLLPASARAHCV